MKMPWGFSIPQSENDGVPNLPSPLGAALGREIARLVDAEEAVQRERFPNMLPRCDDCAARLGTVPNQCAATLMDLIKCATEGEPFYCHKGVNDNEPKRLCAGYALMLSEPRSDESRNDGGSVSKALARGGRRE